MLISRFFEECAVLDLNMTGFSEVVQRSHTGGSLIQHMWDQRTKKKFFLHNIFSHFLKLNYIVFFCMRIEGEMIVIHAKSSRFAS